MSAYQAYRNRVVAGSSPARGTINIKLENISLDIKTMLDEDLELLELLEKLGQNIDSVKRYQHVICHISNIKTCKKCLLILFLI